MKVVLQNNKEKHQRSPCSLILDLQITVMYVSSGGMDCCTQFPIREQRIVFEGYTPEHEHVIREQCF